MKQSRFSEFQKANTSLGSSQLFTARTNYSGVCLDKHIIEDALARLAGLVGWFDRLARCADSGRLSVTAKNMLWS